LPNCLHTVAMGYQNQAQEKKDNFWLIGNCLTTGTINWVFKSKAFTKRELLSFWDHVIAQPSVFWGRSLIRQPILNENLHYAMDLDLWLRMRNLAAPVSVDADLAVARYYEDTKTSKGDFKRYLEIQRILTENNDQQEFLSNKNLSKKLFGRFFKDYVHK